MNTDRIRELNDAHRARVFNPGGIVVTPGVGDLGVLGVMRVLQKVRKFTEFDESNDPHHEHDFGAFDYEGEKYFFKIDYYNLTLDGGSPDPSDDTVTKRVMTVMRADEY